MPRRRIATDEGAATQEADAAPAPTPSDEGPGPDARGTDSAPTKAMGATAHYPGHLRDSALSMFTHAAMAPFLKGISWESFRLYRDRLLADCGGPTDPVEIMIIEQLSMAHLSLGLVSCKAATAGRPEVVGVYSAAARLMGKFRRSALALQAYRAASRQLAVAGTGTTVALPAGSADLEGDPERIHQSTEMGQPPRDSDEGPPVLPMPRAASV